MGHIEICDDVHVSAATRRHAIDPQARAPTPAIYPFQEHRELDPNAAHLRHMDALAENVRRSKSACKNWRAYAHEPPWTSHEILRYLPHRYPFLLVDRVLELRAGTSASSALKNVTINEPFFQGHFPASSR